MGGCAIAFTYLLEEYYAQRPNVFNAVAANAPLIQPVTAPFPYAVAVLIGEAMHAVGLDTSYPPTKGGSFEEIYTYDAQRPVRLNLNYFHNIWFETDSIRNPALAEVYDFYDRLGATQPPSQNNLPDMCPWWKGWCAFGHCDCIWSCSHPAANGRCRTCIAGRC